MLLTLILLDVEFLFNAPLWPEKILEFGVLMFSVLYYYPPKLALDPSIPPVIYGYRFGIEARS